MPERSSSTNGPMYWRMCHPTCGEQPPRGGLILARSAVQECPTCTEGLRVLDLVAPASEEEIRTAYRDLAKVWHPDRFQGDARLSAKTEAQFKRVQSAYQAVLAHLTTDKHDTQVGAEPVEQAGSGPAQRARNARATWKVVLEKRRQSSPKAWRAILFPPQYDFAGQVICTFGNSGAAYDLCSRANQEMPPGEGYRYGVYMDYEK